MIEALNGYPANVWPSCVMVKSRNIDYEAVLIPAVTKALRQHDKVRLYYETASDFAGIDPSAVWEDTKVGISHLSRWERFAVVTDVDWIRHTMKFFSFLMPGEMKVFPTSQAKQAREWIVA